MLEEKFTTKYFNKIYGGNMKFLFSVIAIFCLFIFNSCSNNSSPTSAGGGGLGGPGGGGGSSVTFGITQAAGTTGIIFYSTPSTAVVIADVNVSVPAASFTKDYTDATGTVYPANKAVEINEFTGVASGQKWVFVFTGHLGSATGTAFSVTSNYTVP
jgi:hypothetical protein